MNHPSNEMYDTNLPDPVSRRQFLKTAALGTLGALILQQKAHASSLGSSQRVLTILGAVDIAQALADGDITNNIYWTDNNRLFGSRNEGTNSLISSVNKGDVLNWVVIGLEVETMVSIHSFEGTIIPIASPAPDPTSPFGAWKGVVNTDLRYTYPYTVNLLVEDIVMPMTTSLALQRMPTAQKNN